MSTLDPDRWLALTPHLDHALGLSGDERAVYLVSLREQDRALADELHALLDVHQALVDERFLECAPAALAGQLALAGQTLGAYTLRSPIGQGGMGSVWLADRTDGRFERRAAIKLLNGALLGRGEARFKREGSLLARLVHPHIAQLTDAGISAAGQPFLVLEYVDGEPIDRHCDQRALGVDARVRLFLDVLGAVAHAHANLIVHRDIKPSNVFVTPDGGVKLLDFGIAKLLEDEEHPGAAAMLTREGGGALTPAYAAPEQLAGGRVSTATDVYALGVLLYRLLTGRHPAGDHLHSPADLVKAIVDTAPRRASDAVAPTATEDESAATNAARRASSPDKLRRLLRGDLDTILLRALKKKPGERYVSVTAFADDLRRYLHHEPISARPDTIAYRSAKFVRRNWLPVAAIVLTVVGLATGLYVANRERVVAQRRFADVRQLANKLFDIDNQVRQLSGSTKARQLIVDTSLEYLRRLSADVQGDPELALEVATAYMSVAQVEGVTTSPNLGQVDEADRDLTIADEVIQTVLASQPGNRTALLRAAQIATDRMWVAWQAERGGEALAFARRAAEWLDKFQARKSDQQDAAVILNMYLHVAHHYMLQEQFDEALRLCSRGSKLATLFERPLERGSFLMTVALARRYRGELDGALEAAHESARLLDPDPLETRTPPRMNFALALTYEGWILGEDEAISLGRSDEALAVLQRAFTITDDIVHQDPNDESSRSKLFLAGAAIADILRHSDAARALTVYDHTLEDMEAVHGKFLQLRGVYLLAASSYALRALGRPADARQRLDRAFASLKELKLYPAEKIETGSEAERALRALADHEADTGQLAPAIDRYQRLLDQLAAGGANPETSLQVAMDLSHVYQSMAALQRRAGKADLASRLDARRVQVWQHWETALPNNPFVLRQIAATRLDEH